jgi:hypothetical protein
MARMYVGPQWPPERFLVRRGSVTFADWTRFDELVRTDATEGELQRILRDHPGLIGGAAHFDRPNAHVSWVIPQASIRAPFTHEQRGLRPDYLVGGVGSDGFSWVVVELKGARERIFARDQNGGGLRLSAAANRGLCQLLSYLDFCATHQAYLREFLNARSFREPKGILFIGRANEVEGDAEKQALKAALNRAFSGRVQIRTLDALCMSVVNVL